MNWLQKLLSANWDYKVIGIKVGVPAVDLLTELKSLGKVGWELVWMGPLPGGDSRFVAILKRPA